MYNKRKPVLSGHSSSCPNVFIPMQFKPHFIKSVFSGTRG